MSTSIQRNMVDEACLVKPVNNKRSLASILSIENNSDITSTCLDRVQNLPTKRRKFNVDSKWELQDLPELPFLYLKEKTSVVLLNENPQRIASRIVDCAKTLRAYGQFNGEKAKATLTVDNMEFSIQLFKVTEKTNECVIVELQRTNGSSIQFHKVARTILEVAKETKNDLQTPLSPTSTSKVDVIEHLPKTLNQCKNEKKKRDQEDVFTCTLEMVDALLKKDRVDANLLGMESLQLLTTPESASDDMVNFVSNIVITGESFCDIKGTISSLIAKYTIDGESPNNDVEEEYYHKMRVCALTILYNSLKSFFDQHNSMDASEIDSILSSHDWLGDHGLLTMLIGELENAKVEPNDAYLAGKSLEIVLLKSPQMRREAARLEVQRIISESFSLGHDSYPILESVSKKLLGILGESKE